VMSEERHNLIEREKKGNRENMVTPKWLPLIDQTQKEVDNTNPRLG
jgi:hypothetical protein